MTDKAYTFKDLVGITKRLTAEDGCPWDKAQTHKSIRINMLEEAYEAVDAIDSGSVAAMVEELGDVMLQTVLHADIARRSGEFCIDDVIATLCNKLVARHTHIFGLDKASNSDDAIKFWEQAKAKEKQLGLSKVQTAQYPNCFPSALRAQKIFKKLFKDFSADYVMDLFLAALKNLSADNAGRFLFLAVALCSLRGADAEVALNGFCKEVVGAGL